MELLDKDGNVIGSGTTDDTGHVTITPTKPIPEGNVLRKLMTMQKFLMLRLLNQRKQLIRHPTTPTLDTDLGGKAGTQTPITVTTDPNTHVDLLDKDGNIIGSGTTDDTGHVTLHRQNLFLKVMSLPKRRIMQNIRIVLHLNRKATDTTPPTAPVVTSDLTGKATTTILLKLRIQIRKWNY